MALPFLLLIGLGGRINFFTENCVFLGAFLSK
jgi:hypothetical protein